MPDENTNGQIPDVVSKNTPVEMPQDIAEPAKEKEANIPVQENIPQSSPEAPDLAEATPDKTAGEAELLAPVESTQSKHTIPEKEISVEQIGNKVIEKSGDTITITETVSPQNNKTPRMILDTKFPTPFIQKDLWKKFLNKLGDRKSKKLNKVMQFLEKNKKITNDEVEKLLHVSDATATRYLDQLEKEGKICQVGRTGKYTHYEKI